MDKKNFFLVHDGHSADELPFIELKSYHWEAPVPYRPRTFAKMFVLNNELSARLICYESSPKAVYNSRDERIWCDSCLEFFVAPLSSRSEYINIETNSRGAYLSQFGASRDGRVFLKTLTDIAPDVKSFKGEDESGAFWGVDVRISKKLLSALYKESEENIDFSSVRANFYKCGDECETPHYIAMFPVTTLPPGFHNPGCFKEFKLIERV